MKVFVVNAYKERKEKYNDNYELYDAVWWEGVKENEYSRYNLRYNAKTPLRQKIAACSMSHKNLLNKIIEEDLTDVFVIEDDAIIDNFDSLKKVMKEANNEFCYIGGDLFSPLNKDAKEFKSKTKDEIRKTLKEGINIINPDKFIILNTHGYYIPNKSVAEDILNYIPNAKKEKAIDIEYKSLQKKKIIKKFIYPAISILVVDEAKNGFSKMYNNFTDDKKYY